MIFAPDRLRFVDKRRSHLYSAPHEIGVGAGCVTFNLAAGRLRPIGVTHRTTVLAPTRSRSPENCVVFSSGW